MGAWIAPLGQNETKLSNYFLTFEVNGDNFLVFNSETFGDILSRRGKINCHF